MIVLTSWVVAVELVVAVKVEELVTVNTFPCPVRKALLRTKLPLSDCALL